jgi:hypothetical protein
MPPAVQLDSHAHPLFGNLPTSDVGSLFHHMIYGSDVNDVSRRDLMLILAFETAYPNVNRLLKGELSN